MKAGPAWEGRTTYFAWINGELRGPEQALVEVWDHGLLYGDGCFEGLRLKRGRLFRPDQHLSRLQASAKALAISLPYSAEELVDAVRQCAQVNDIRDGHIRIVLTRGPGRPGLDARNADSPTVIVTVYPLPARRSSIRLVTSGVRRRGLAHLGGQVKSLNYLDSILAKQEASAAGVDDALLLDDLGFVSEATAANVILIENGLVIAAQSESALPGITRRSLLGRALELGYETQMQRITLARLYTAQAVLLTGTALGVVPVSEIDGRTLPDLPEIGAKLIEAYEQALVDQDLTRAIFEQDHE